MCQTSEPDASGSDRDSTSAPDAQSGEHASDAQDDQLIEENRKRNASGLSWDELAKDEKNGWHQITEMGEGD